MQLKKKSTWTGLMFIVFSFMHSTAQQHPEKYISRTTHDAGLTWATNGNALTTALSSKQYWGFGRKKRHFKAGLGLRLTSSFGNDELEYITAPARLTSGKTGPAVFFADQLPNNIDTLQLASTQVNAINLLIALRYDFSKKWGFEFNIDAIGFSFGGVRSGVLAYGDDPFTRKVISAKPSVGNVLLISDNDRGSLNSECILFYRCNKNLEIKAGICFLFNEYKVQQPVQYYNSKGNFIDASTYRTKLLMGGIGFNYIFKYP